MSILIFTSLIWWHAKALYAADLERVRAARRLAVQHSATRVLAETPAEGDVMPIILKGICETLEWRAALVWERDEQAEKLKCAQTWPVERERLAAAVQNFSVSTDGDSALIEFLKASRNIGFGRGEGLPGQVWAKKQPLWIADFPPDTSMPRASLADRADLHGAVGVPILIGGRLLGVMEFFSARVEMQDDELLEVLGAAGSQLGQFLERKRAQEQLRQASANLERSNTELQQFVYVASHDLFEPMRMVLSYLDLLSDHNKGKLDKDSQEFIGFAVDGAERMQALINDLLAYSRLELRNRSFDVLSTENALGAAVANLKVAIQESGAKITHDPLPKVCGDAVQLTQVFQNLISNAIKFRGATEPRIHVGAAQRDGEWRFSVRDNGIGIDQKHFERIFIIFQRLHTRHEYPGTGMGLAICKKIVERHGGRISLESAPGKGSTFFFTLPTLKQE